MAVLFRKQCKNSLCGGYYLSIVFKLAGEIKLNTLPDCAMVISLIKLTLN